MLSSNAKLLLIILFKSNQTEKIVISRNLSSFGHFYHYKSIISTDDQRWTDAFISQIDDQEKIYQIDTKSLTDLMKKEYNAENVFVATMIHSIDCIKDTSNDPENDVFFAVAFQLEEKVDQFPEDWFKATPYMSSCDGFKRAIVYKVIGDNNQYPYINLAIWSSLNCWKQAIATEQSKQAHAHQNHVRRIPFIAKFVQ